MEFKIVKAKNVKFQRLEVVHYSLPVAISFVDDGAVTGELIPADVLEIVRYLNDFPKLFRKYTYAQLQIYFERLKEFIRDIKPIEKHLCCGSFRFSVTEDNNIRVEIDARLTENLDKAFELLRYYQKGILAGFELKPTK